MKFLIESELNPYSIFYRWDKSQKAYEIWVEDSREKLYPEIFHDWIGDKISLNFEINQLEYQYKTKAKRYK